MLDAYRKSASADEQASLLSDARLRWDLLADASRGPGVWKAIARQMGPQALRMNLNTLLRHEILSDAEIVDFVAARIADAEEIRSSRQFPYQYLAAYLNAEDTVPQKVKAALCQAAEIACGNVPVLPGPVVIGLDVSGSMQSPVTGGRGRGATTKVRCVDLAALFAAAVLRRNPDSVVIPFDDKTYRVRLDPQDTILSLAERLAKWRRLSCSHDRGQALACPLFTGPDFLGDVLAALHVEKCDFRRLHVDVPGFSRNPFPLLGRLIFGHFNV